MSGPVVVVCVVSQEEFTRVEVEYCCLPGWNCSTEHVRRFSDLPANAQAFVAKIEQLADVHGEFLKVCVDPAPSSSPASLLHAVYTVHERDFSFICFQCVDRPYVKFFLHVVIYNAISYDRRV